jgi:hypothetical protein
MTAQYHGPRKKFKYRIFEVNGAFIALLFINSIKGGYSAWGSTRNEALTNVMNLAGHYIKTL